MLRALGYLAPPEQRAEMAGMDAKDGMAVYAALQEARQLAQLAEWARAEALLDEVLAAAPNNVTARNVLALAAVRRGDYAAAERIYGESLARDPRQHRVLGALGALALRRRDLDAATTRFQEALVLAPTYVEAMSNLGFIAAMRRDDAGAEAWYRKAIALDPTYPHVHRRLGDLFYDRHDWARALEYYRRVRVAVPSSFEVVIQAGNAARFLGDDATARRYYADAARLRPDSWIPPYSLACLAALRGDVDPALAALDDAVARGLALPDLLDDNDHFAALRATPAWAPLMARVQAAAILRPPRLSCCAEDCLDTTKAVPLPRLPPLGERRNDRCDHGWLRGACSP